MSCTDLFLSCLSALQPENLLEAAVHYDHSSRLLTVRTTGAVLDLSSGCYIVGFGKVPLGNIYSSQVMWKLFG